MAAKRKRGSGGDDKTTIYYNEVSISGFCEIDNLVQAGKFRLLVSNLGITSIRTPVPVHVIKHKMLKFEDFRKTLKPATDFGTDKNMEDHISRLPDDILMFIISLLTMREGAATSILSNRWRKLWITSVSCLHFDDSDLFGYMYPSDYFQVKEKKFHKKEQYNRTMRFNRILQLCHLKKKGFLESERAKFIRRVYRIWRNILQHQRALPLHALRVSFPLGKESAPHLDKWMKLAAAKGVTQLELDFNFTEFDSLCSGDFDNAYMFPVQGFGSSLSYLRLNYCIFDFPPNFQGFNSLVSLSLNNTLLTNNSLQNILRNCPLEWLSLRSCKFSNSAILKFVGSSIVLKHLDIARCDIKEIEVHDVNILSFEVQAYKTKLSIKNVCRLAKLALDANGPVQILSNFPHIKTLFLKHGSKLPKLCVFNNLNRLVFSVDYRRLFDVVCFLEACPVLEQLDLDMDIFYKSFEWHTELTKENTTITGIPDCPHNNLKRVIMYAFVSHPEQIKLARYLKMHLYWKRWRYTQLVSHTVVMAFGLERMIYTCSNQLRLKMPVGCAGCFEKRRTPPLSLYLLQLTLNYYFP